MGPGRLILRKLNWHVQGIGEQGRINIEQYTIEPVFLHGKDMCPGYVFGFAAVLLHGHARFPRR
jgi:hypothetical protein